MTSTRNAVLHSWWAARRKVDATHSVTLTAASFAGYALDVSGGDVERALRLVPPDADVFWARVRQALEIVDIEERSPLRLAR